VNKIIFGLVLAGLLASCASKETKESQQATKPEMGVAKGTLQTFGGPAAAAPVAQALPSERSIYFDFDKSIVKDEYRPVVQDNAQYMVNNSSARITIQGNCDERGSREYNLGLGQRRADSKKHAMMVLGASGSKIETVSFGKEKPRCTDHTESCWSQNRRTDVVYQGE
jgi:peptidoglycan-associated lipoprotein